MTRPSILVVTHYYSTHRGGVEMYAGRVAERLAKRGYKITWAASDVNPPPETCAGIECLPMPADNRMEDRLGVPYPLWTTQARAKLREAVRGADVLHLHEALYQGNVVAARTAARCGIPTLVTQHIGFVPYKNPALRAALSIANRRIAMKTLRGSQALAFISETTQEYFKSLGLRHPNAQLIPSGVETGIFAPTGSDARESFGLRKDRPLCLFVGRFVEKKGLPILQRLAQGMPGVQWALVGWGPIDPAVWGLSNVHVFKGLAGPTLAPLYRAADLFVLPSVGEGFPAVIQEAFACGTPVLVNDETAQGYTPARALMHTVPGPDPHAWIQGVAGLFENRAALCADGRRLVDFAHTHWSWDVCIDRYEQLIQSVAEGAS